MKTIAYLEHNNAGKNIMYNYNGKWWCEQPDTNGYIGKVDIFATNEYNEPIPDENIATQLREQFIEWDFFDGYFFDEDAEYYIPEYDGMEIEDIDAAVNYNPDGTRIGHDETTWTKICEIEV